MLQIVHAIDATLAGQLAHAADALVGGSAAAGAGGEVHLAFGVLVHQSVFIGRSSQRVLAGDWGVMGTVGVSASETGGTKGGEERVDGSLP